MPEFALVFKVMSVALVVALADRFLQRHLRRYMGVADSVMPGGGILQGSARLVVFGLGLVVLLDSFGVSMTPVVASLGIGSLAFALALRPTLENFFAGLHLIVDKPLQVGHFVKLESGEEGFVHQIGWRSTWLRARANFVVAIPNKTLINCRIINYDYPDRQMSVIFEAGVHYASDLEKVERIALTKARETLREVPGGVSGFEPILRFHTFGDSRINFSVILRVEEFGFGPPLKHEYARRLRAALRDEGIEISLPIKAINFDQEFKFSGTAPHEYARYVRGELN